MCRGGGAALQLKVTQGNFCPGKGVQEQTIPVHLQPRGIQAEWSPQMPAGDELTDTFIVMKAVGCVGGAEGLLPSLCC